MRTFIGTLFILPFAICAQAQNLDVSCIGRLSNGLPHRFDVSYAPNPRPVLQETYYQDGRTRLQEYPAGEEKLAPIVDSFTITYCYWMSPAKAVKSCMEIDRRTGTYEGVLYRFSSNGDQRLPPNSAGKCEPKGQGSNNKF